MARFKGFPDIARVQPIESATLLFVGAAVQDVRPMFDRLREHVARLVPLTDEEFLSCTSLMVPKRVRKGSYLAQEGEVAKYLSFVTKGCLRAYGIDKKGEEHIVQFALEGWWISDLYSFLTGKPGEYFIDALEDSDVLLIDANAYEKLCTTVSKFERYFRILLQNNYIATHKRVLASIGLSAEERYLQMLEDYPTIVRRVAQRHIASYLGITPEALSRIRHRMVKEREKGGTGGGEKGREGEGEKGRNGDVETPGP